MTQLQLLNNDCIIKDNWNDLLPSFLFPFNTILKNVIRANIRCWICLKHSHKLKTLWNVFSMTFWWLFCQLSMTVQWPFNDLSMTFQRPFRQVKLTVQRAISAQLSSLVEDGDSDQLVTPPTVLKILTGQVTWWGNAILAWIETGYHFASDMFAIQANPLVPGRGWKK